MLCSGAIFVHVPKTAGQSINKALRELSGLDWEEKQSLERRRELLLKENKNLDPGPPKLTHLKASEYVTCGFVSSEQFDSCFKFSFVRNPWDRLVSEYRFRNHYWRFDFKSFLFDHFPNEPGTDAYVHILPQYDFLFDTTGQCLVDFIGRFENLQADFNSVCQKLSIERITLPHKNNSAKKRPRIRDVHKFVRWCRGLKSQRDNTFGHYTQYYDDESKEFVRYKYRQDIEMFRYGFGDP